MLGKTTSQSTVYGYNCDKSEKIEHLNKQYVSQGQEDVKPFKKVTYNLLQKTQVHHAQGFSLQMCGLWSYQKYANVPHIQEEKEISVEDC